MTEPVRAASDRGPAGHRLVRLVGAAVLTISVLSLVAANPASAQVLPAGGQVAAAGGSLNGAVSSSSAVLPPTGGGTWSVIASPSEPNSHLESVTCTSDSDCWAVGNYQVNPQSTRNLIEHWNGTTWTIVTSPDADDTDGLSAVTCVSASDCWAVGYSAVLQVGEAAQTLTEHWDGAAWSIVPSPTPMYLAGYLVAVACVSTSDCWAVGGDHGPPGQFSNGSLIEHWNGSVWSVESFDESGDILNSVDCVGVSDCWAVGSTSDTDFGQTFAEHWDGSTWSEEPSPNVDSPQHNVLSSVSCSASSDCWAVGTYTGTAVRKKQPIRQSLAEHWDGTTWSVVPTPDSGPRQDNGLTSVTCTSSTACWAVGFPALQWDGIAWTTTASESVAGVPGGLSSVSCTASAACWSVGASGDGTADQTLTEHFTPTAVVVTPASGPTGTTVSTTGTGFPFGKHVKVTYFTGTATGRQSFTLCSTAAGADGSFACHGTIPLKNAGLPGLHTIEATGPRSLVVASATFDLT